MPGDQRRGEGEPALIAGMTRHVMQIRPIDPDRVYVAGLSAGGAMAAILAREYPDLFAAAGIHSGIAAGGRTRRRVGLRGDEGRPRRHIRLADGERRLDVAVAGVPHRHGGDGAVDVRLARRARDRLPWRRRFDRRGGQWRCGDRRRPRPGRRESRSDTDGPPPQRPARLSPLGLAADDAAANAPSLAEQWIVRGAPHAWSGGAAAGSYTDPAGPDASREMLRFFLEHPRRRAKPDRRGRCRPRRREAGPRPRRLRPP